MSVERIHTHFERCLGKLCTLAGLQVNLKRVIMKKEEARSGEKKFSEILLLIQAN